MTGSAIVTGGASGLGRATSAELVRRGLEVVIADRNTELGKRTAEEIGAHFMATEVTDEDSVAAAVEAAVIAAPLRAGGRELRGGDMVAAVLDRAGTQLPASTFTDVVQINLIGTFLLMRWAAAARPPPIRTSTANGGSSSTPPPSRRSTVSLGNWPTPPPKLGSWA